MTDWSSVARFLNGLRSANRSLVAGALSLALIASVAPLHAGWFGKKTVRKPEPAAANPTQGYAGTIRRLQKEAQAAASRGDRSTARTLAERAHKLSVTCRAMLANDPDCSPEATADLVRKYSGETPTPDAPLAPQQPAVAHALDLKPLLDETHAAEATFVPPSPRPTNPVTPPSTESPSPPRRDIASPVQRPEPNGPSPQHSDRPVVSNAAPTPGASPPAPPTFSVAAPQPSLPDSTRFLVMRADWLGDAGLNSHKPTDTRNKLQLTPDRTARARAKAPEFDIDEDEEEPEVTSAIGRSDDARWELDVGADEADPSLDSPPHPDAQPIRHFPADETSDLGQDDVVEQSLDKTHTPSARHARDVLTLTEFLDPDVTADASSQVDPPPAPAVIETSFNASSEVTSPRPNAPSEPVRRHESHLTGRTAGEAPLPRTRQTPAVTVREEPALDWLPVADSSSAARTDDPRFRLAWPQTAAGQAITGGLLLIAIGASLFAISFRQS